MGCIESDLGEVYDPSTLDLYENGVHMGKVSRLIGRSREGKEIFHANRTLQYESAAVDELQRFFERMYVHIISLFLCLLPYQFSLSS